MSENQSSTEIWVHGIHPVEEALRAPHARVHEILSGFDHTKSNDAWVQLAKEKRVRIDGVSRNELDRRAGTDKHQNLVARVSVDTWASLTDRFAEFPPDERFLGIALDGIQDPQNGGSILRSARFFGASVAVVPRDRTFGLTGVVAKASAGAVFSIPIVRAVNLARELEVCEKKGIWRIGLDAGAEKSLDEMDLGTGATMLVVGSEGEGLRPLTQKRCDVSARLLARGEMDSLNASVAGAIALYEVFRQRLSHRPKT